MQYVLKIDIKINNGSKILIKNRDIVFSLTGFKK